MATYKGKAVTVPQSNQQLYDKISDLSALRNKIEELPEEARQRLGEVKFGDDEVAIMAPAVGELRFRIVDRVSPSQVKLQAVNSPVPFFIIMNLKPIDAESTELQTVLDAEIPAMLRPMIGGKLQEAADKFGEMFNNFFA